MFSHIVIGADDVERSRKFYDAVLQPLGVSPGTMDSRGRAIYMTPQGLFVVTKPINGNAVSCANGSTIGFAASSADAVDRWHAAGIAHGGTTCEDLPGWRDSEYGQLYAAYLRDPSGHKLCALHRSAEG